MHTFQEQFARVKRYLARIEDRNRYPIDYEDDLWSFFQNCWHLKDWLKNDSSVPSVITQKVENDLKNCSSLMICADLANRSKHLKLTTPPPRKDAKVKEKKITAVVNEVPGTTKSESSISIDFIITFDSGSTKSALDVARSAIKEWQTLISGYGLSLT
jgi:hypothetical protein